MQPCAAYYVSLFSYIILSFYAEVRKPHLIEMTIPGISTLLPLTLIFALIFTLQFICNAAELETLSSFFNSPTDPNPETSPKFCFNLPVH